uniref:Arf-GAP domain-containing protein n=1 Tax=Coccolithus braarudii TaxID=221442 RepID=A0A7S0L849_9EUKA
MHRRLGVHVSFCRSVGMDKWTYRQIYRCAVGGNVRARDHWKRAGVDTHDKIDNKYSSMTAQNYKAALEKDVSDACRRGLVALQERAGVSGTEASVGRAAPSDPFADYINAMAPTQPNRSKSLTVPAVPAGGLGGAPTVRRHISGPEPAQSAPSGLIMTTPIQGGSSAKAAPTPPANGGSSLLSMAGALGSSARAALAAAPAPAAMPVPSASAASPAIPIIPTTPVGAPSPAVPGLISMPRPKSGVRRTGGLGAKKTVALTISPAAPPPPTTTATDPTPAVTVVPASPAPVQSPASRAPALISPALSKPATPASRPMIPVPIPKQAAPAASAASSGLSSAWDDLEASLSKPNKPGSGLNMTFTPAPATVAAAGTNGHSALAAIGNPTPGPAPATALNGAALVAATPALTPSAAELESKPAPMLFNPLQATCAGSASKLSVARKQPAATKAKRLGGGRMQADAPNATLQFDDFDMNAVEPESAASIDAAGDVEADWSWADSKSNVKAQAPPTFDAASDADDPWAERPSSSLFAYEAPSLHASRVARA